jgi:DNA-directed RNA polymerase specialized sigma24 family protein
MARAPIDLLASEWKLLAHSPRFLARFQAWRAGESALTRFADPDAVVRFLHGPGSRSQKDSVLCALLAWAKEDPLGGHIVLEALRPGFMNLSVRLSRGAREREELRAMLSAALWEGIRTYPLARRPRRVAANLLLDTMHRTLVELGRESAWRGSSAFTDMAVQERPGAGDVDGDVEALLGEAVHAQVLTAEEAELILCTRIDGAELSALADALGVSYNAVRVRRQRAERRLLIFLGFRPVLRGPQSRPSSFARVAGAGS